MPMTTSPEPPAQRPFEAPAPPPAYGPATAPQPRPPIRPKKPMSQLKLGLLILGIVVGGFTLLLVAALLVPNLGGGTSGTKGDDVQVTSCSSQGGEFDMVGTQAEIQVTNHDTRAHSYTITVAFTDSSGSTQYATGSASISDLAPGQTGTATATSWQPGKPIGSCKIIRFNRSIF